MCKETAQVKETTKTTSNTFQLTKGSRREVEKLFCWEEILTESGTSVMIDVYSFVPLQKTHSIKTSCQQ